MQADISSSSLSVGKDLVHLSLSPHPCGHNKYKRKESRKRKREDIKCSPNNSPESFNDSEAQGGVGNLYIDSIFHLDQVYISHPLRAVSLRITPMEFD